MAAEMMVAFGFPIDTEDIPDDVYEASEDGDYESAFKEFSTDEESIAPSCDVAIIGGGWSDSRYVYHLEGISEPWNDTFAICLLQIKSVSATQEDMEKDLQEFCAVLGIPYETADWHVVCCGD